MLNLPALNIVFMLIFSFVLAGMYLIAYPVLFARPIYLYALPCLLVLMYIFFRDRKLFLSLILFTRALLDPLLNESKFATMGVSIGLGAAINLTIIGFWLWIKITSRTAHSGNTGGKAWWGYLLLSALAIAYSPVKGDAIKLWFNLLTYAALFDLPRYVIRNAEDKKYWLKVLVYASVIPLCYAYYDLFVRKGKFFADAGIRIYGTFTHPNILAFYMLLTVIAVFYILNSPLFSLSGTKRRIMGGYFILALGIVLATKTRSAWLACWVFFMLYGVSKDRRVVVMALIAPLAVLANKDIAFRMQDLFSRTGGSFESGLNSFAWRVSVWKLSLAEISRNFLLGNGLSSFQNASRNFLMMSEAQGMGAHNSFLQVLFETGVFGLLAYLSVFGALVRHAVSKRMRRLAAPDSSVCLALVSSYITTCLSDNMLYYLAYNWYFWFFVGIISRELPGRRDVAHGIDEP